METDRRTWCSKRRQQITEKLARDIRCIKKLGEANRQAIEDLAKIREEVLREAETADTPPRIDHETDRIGTTPACEHAW